MSFLFNYVKIMIILLTLDDKGITLKLHSHGWILARLVARNLLGGGVVSEVWNQTETVYTRNWNVFCPKLD